MSFNKETPVARPQPHSAFFSLFPLLSPSFVSFCRWTGPVFLILSCKTDRVEKQWCQYKRLGLYSQLWMRKSSVMNLERDPGRTYRCTLWRHAVAERAENEVNTAERLILFRMGHKFFFSLAGSHLLIHGEHWMHPVLFCDTN